MTDRSFTTGVGRIVGGDVFVARDKDQQGRPLTTLKGEPKSEFILQVAFPKGHPDTDRVIGEIMAAAQEAFPQRFANGAPPFGQFSYKMQDGDDQSTNQAGRVWAEKEGYPGHWVLSFKTGFAPAVYDTSNPPAPIAWQEGTPTPVKRGYWVRVHATVRGNGQQQKPGVYLNHDMVQFCAYGEEIRGGPDASEAFGDAPAQLPAGASASPVAPTTPMPGGAAPPAGPPAGPPPGVPATPPGAAPPAMPPGAAPTPQPGFGMPPAGAGAPGAGAAPPPPGAPPAPPAPPAGPQMAPGCPHTYEALRGAGWTDEQMRAAGHLL